MGTRLFVGNLPYSAGEGELRAIFEPRWIVVEARIVTDRETGRSRGFGFVELEQDPQAQEAIKELDGKEMNGRRLAVREAHDRQPKPRGGPGGPRGRPDVPVEQAARRPFAPRPDRDGPPRGGPARSGPGGGGGGRPPWEGDADWAARKGENRKNERRVFEAQAEERKDSSDGWSPTDGDEGEGPPPAKGGGAGRNKKKRDRSDTDW